jgi:hypothetical protein
MTEFSTLGKYPVVKDIKGKKRKRRRIPEEAKGR